MSNSDTRYDARASDQVYYSVEIYPRSGLKVKANEKLEKKIKNPIDKSDTFVYSGDIYLANADTSRIKIEAWPLSGEPIEHSAGLAFSGATSDVRFITTDADLATRLKAAVQHAAELCGAKPDVF